MYTRLVGPLPREIQRRVPPTWKYVGETPTEYIFVDSSHNHLGGSIGEMFKRMFKFTPKSFTMANISRSIYRLTPVSLVGQLVAPKLERQIYQKVAPILVPVIAGSVAAYTMGPAIMSMLGPKLAAAGSFLGKHAATIGGGLMKVMSGLAESKQAEVAQQITPQQIAQVEQTGQIPVDLQRILDRGLQQSYYPPPPPYAIPPPPEEAVPAPQPVQAGAMGGGMLLPILGITAIGVLFFQAQGSPATRRRK